MFLTLSKIYKLPVAALEEKKKIGHVSQIIFDPANGNILAVMIKTTAIFAKDLFLSANDILDFDNNAIVTKSQENLLEASQLIKVGEVLKQRIPIIGQKALTESGKKLGTIYDLLIDTGNLNIFKFYIHNILQEKILPADKVVRIEKKAVIFSDDMLEQTPLLQSKTALA